MRYIKTYRLFENDSVWKTEEEKNQDIDSIKSMFGDLSDDNMYNIEVSHVGIFDKSTLNISLSLVGGKAKYGLFRWSDVKSNIYQVLDMMDDKYEFIKMEIYRYNPSGRNPLEELFVYSIDDLSNLKDKDKLKNINIYLSLK